MNELLFGINIEEIEKITGEPVKVIKKWKKGTQPIPESTARLLRLYLTGDASALLGNEWKGYRFNDHIVQILPSQTGLLMRFTKLNDVTVTEVQD